jgi:hypothetical protein
VNKIFRSTFDAARAIFEEHEPVDEGLGPVYNADSCAGCHSNPVTAAISQVTELRAGSFNGTAFVEPIGSVPEFAMKSAESADGSEQAEHQCVSAPSRPRRSRFVGADQAFNITELAPVTQTDREKASGGNRENHSRRPGKHGANPDR